MRVICGILAPLLVLENFWSNKDTKLTHLEVKVASRNEESVGEAAYNWYGFCRDTMFTSSGGCDTGRLLTRTCNRAAHPSAGNCGWTQAVCFPKPGPPQRASPQQEETRRGPATPGAGRGGHGWEGSAPCSHLSSQPMFAGQPPGPDTHRR